MPLKILALRALYESRQLVVEHEGVAQTHHLQASGGYSEVELHRLRGDQGNALDNPEAGVDEFVFGDNVINDANAERFLGVVSHVARQGVPRPTPHAPPVHGRDHGFREFPDLQELGCLSVGARAPGVEYLGGALALRQARGPDRLGPLTPDIIARGKGTAHPCHDNGTHLRVLLRLVEGRREFILELATDGVQRLWTVPRNEHAFALLLVQDCVVGRHNCFASCMGNVSQRNCGMTLRAMSSISARNRATSPVFNASTTWSTPALW